MSRQPSPPLPDSLREWVERPTTTLPETAGQRLRLMVEGDDRRKPASQESWLRYVAMVALLVGASWTALQLAPDNPPTVSSQASVTAPSSPMLAMTLESGSTLYLPLGKESQ